MPETASTTQNSGPIVKKVIFIILYTISALAFGNICGQVQTKYLTIMMMGPETTGLGISLIVSLIALSVFTGLLAILVRPLWITLSAYAIGAIAILFFIGFYPATLVAALLFVVFSYSYTSSIHKKFDNQIKFSPDPLFTSQSILLIAMVLLVTASFAMGYAKDAKNRGFMIPTELKQTANEFMMKQTKETAKKAGTLPPEQLSAGLETAKAELDKTWTGLETELKPYTQYVPVFLGITIFITLQSILIFFTWIPPLLLSAIFPLLKMIGVTTVTTETKVVSRITL